MLDQIGFLKNRSRPWILGAAGIAAALVWAQFRGFDPLDAATHFLTYQFPEDNTDTHTHYAQLARPLWLLCGSDIVWFRLLTLALVAGSTWFFWHAWRPLLAENVDSAPAGLSLGLSALAGMAWLPVLLGYNSLATIFTLLGLGTLAPIIGIPTGSPLGARHYAIGTLLFLVSVSLAMLAKPPAGVALAVFGGLLVLNRWRPPRALNWILFFVATAAAAAGLVTLGRASATPGFDPAAPFSFGGINISPAWIVSILDRYAAELAPFMASLGRDALFIALPAVMLAVVVFRRARGLLCPRWLVSAALIASSLALVAVTALRALWDGSYAHAVSGEMARLYLLFWLALAPALSACLWTPGAAGTDARRRAPIVAALFFLPLTSGFGSTNTLYFSALHGTVLWTAGLLLVARCIATLAHLPRLNFGVACALSLAAAAHLFSGHFLRPYMNQPPLWRQNIAVSVGWPATTLRLDPESARFIEQVRATLVTHGFRPGDDVFGFFNLPGIVYAVGAKQPGAPWYFGTWYGGDDTDGGKIRQVPLERRQRAWIITQADLSAFSRQFRECAIDFPAGYEKIGETVNPTTTLPIAIWKTRARP
jgi:hypothetical protein